LGKIELILGVVKDIYEHVILTLNIFTVLWFITDDRVGGALFSNLTIYVFKLEKIICFLKRFFDADIIIFNNKH